LIDLLDRNKIVYSAARAGTANGYSYASRKIENFSTEANDILVSSLQPKSALVKVLFEPNSKLVDSITYDITAWSLPYVYGLNAHATKQNIDVGEESVVTRYNYDIGISNYGYAIKWKGVHTVKTVALLL